MIATVAAFGLGYVLGSRAGRERYAQIVAAAHKASERLESYGSGGGRSARSPDVDQRDDSAGAN
jgi:hypothetical protein